MKNKVFILFLSLFLVLSLFGCVNNGIEEITSDNTGSGSAPTFDTVPSPTDSSAQADAEPECFSITQNGSTYSYYIYNRDGSLAENIDGCTERPEICVTDSDLVRVTIGDETYYYDLESRSFTDTFTGVLDENGTLMVLCDGPTLVICDMFDENGFYKVLDDFSYSLTDGEGSPFVSCEFIDGGGSVRCIYNSTDGERLECFNITNGTKYVTVADWRNQKELLGGDEKEAVRSFLMGYMGTVDYNTGLEYVYEITGSREINGERYYHCECYYRMMEEDGSEELISAAQFVLGEEYSERYDCRENDDMELVVYTENNMI